MDAASRLLRAGLEAATASGDQARAKELRLRQRELAGLQKAFAEAAQRSSDSATIRRIPRRIESRETGTVCKRGIGRVDFLTWPKGTTRGRANWPKPSWPDRPTRRSCGDWPMGGKTWPK